MSDTAVSVWHQRECPLPQWVSILRLVSDMWWVCLTLRCALSVWNFSWSPTLRCESKTTVSAWHYMSVWQWSEWLTLHWVSDTTASVDTSVSLWQCSKCVWLCATRWVSETTVGVSHYGGLFMQSPPRPQSLRLRLVATLQWKSGNEVNYWHFTECLTLRQVSYSSVSVQHWSEGLTLRLVSELEWVSNTLLCLWHYSECPTLLWIFIYLIGKYLIFG
jgi:hypothetical protein